jgi:hypothetical protein
MQNNYSLLVFVSFFLVEVTTLNASQKMPVPKLSLSGINKSSASPVPTPPKLGHPTDRKRINSNDSTPGVKRENSLFLLLAQPKNSTERKPSFTFDSQNSCFESPTKKSVQVVYQSSRKSPDQKSTDY